LNSTSASIDMSQFTSGLYIIKFQCEESVYIQNIEK
jgi:hypothetical protein